LSGIRRRKARLLEDHLGGITNQFKKVLGVRLLAHNGIFFAVIAWGGRD
jgi:hypothetical protein